MASLDGRLRRLEAERFERDWCRCPFDPERERAESLAAMETGQPTPSVCTVCGGGRIAVQYVPYEQLPWGMGARIAERERPTD